MRTAELMVALLLAVAMGCSPTEGPRELLDPDSFYLPRHANLSSRPTGLAEGTITARGQCLYLGSDLLIWPDQYRVAILNGRSVVVGDGWTLAPGDAIALGGGEYATAAEMPSPILGEPPPCSGPYIWVAEVIRAPRSSL